MPVNVKQSNIKSLRCMVSIDLLLILTSCKS